MPNQKISLVYFGTPEIAVKSLEHFINYDDFERFIGLVNSNIITCDYTIDEIFTAIGRQHSLRNQG